MRSVSGHLEVSDQNIKMRIKTKRESEMIRQSKSAKHVFKLLLMKKTWALFGWRYIFIEAQNTCHICLMSSKIIVSNERQATG